jgi:hypothetical protein
MRPPEAASSPVFATLDPTVLDTEMNGIYEDGEMEFVNGGDYHHPSQDAGREFDDIFAHSSQSRSIDNNGLYVSPSEVTSIKQEQHSNSLKRPLAFSLDSPSDSAGDNSSPGSSAESMRDHGRNSSVGSAVHSDGAIKFDSDVWFNAQAFSEKDDNLFGLGNDFSGFDPKYTDIESSNKVMDSAFDFESAASSPMPLKTEAEKHKGSSKTQVNGFGSSKPINMVSFSLLKLWHISELFLQQNHYPASPFYSASSREASPMTSRVPNNARSTSSQWSGRSPSSVLDENFAGPSANNLSVHNVALNSNMNVSHNEVQFGMPNYSANSFYAKSTASAPTRPILHVHPTSLKSRVETQIPIRLTLFPLPAGVKKLRLPTHAISKPKFLAKPDVGRSPEVLELHTSLVCTSAMQDKSKLEKAFSRARGERVKRSSVTSAATDGTQEEGEDTPLDGGDVKICQGCIQRERKRASRKKQRKPDEDELFQKNEDKRVIVFNTNELKDWVEPGKDSSMTFTPLGAMQVELPMRIACYCRHQNEKIGFQ